MDARKWWIDLVLMRRQPNRYILNFSEMEVESKGDEDPPHVGEEDIGEVAGRADHLRVHLNIAFIIHSPPVLPLIRRL